MPKGPPGLTMKLRRYPKTCSGIGLLTAAGLIVYERRRIQQFISKFSISNGKGNNDTKKPQADYIYIKYHIYKESMRKQKEREEENKKWINVIINPVSRYWKAVKHSVAWRLLSIAQNGSHHERLKAVRQLACIDHLKDWDFRHLAQICDARTAVSLARSGADTRWFVPVHMRGVIKNPKFVLNDLHGMLAKLKCKCVEHFFSKYFPEQDTMDDIDEFFPMDKKLAFSPQDTDLLKEVTAFLHHLTKDISISQHLLKEGLLTHLMELRKIFNEDNETLSTLCKVLANVSLVEDSLQHFFQSGWIGTLAEWQNSIDLRLQVISSKALANLDRDDPNYTQYAPNVYLLHPRQRTRQKPNADIVFIHGLLGGVFITWRQKDRKPTELGLYGKNAFYTSETDDIFLVGEQRRFNSKQQNKSSDHNEEEHEHETENETKKEGNSNDKANGVHKDRLLKKANKTEKHPPIKISDTATMELLESLQTEPELGEDWEVVHPDVPLEASENCAGEFSVSGHKWDNQDADEDYTYCWPMEWLPDDYPNARIIGIDYTSALTEWSANFTKYCPCEKGQGQIEVRSSSLLERLSKSDLGQGRPIVWVGHSMGGLLTKLMLMKSVESPDPRVQQIAHSTHSILFLGTPHRGSPIAKWKQHMQMILSPSIEVKEMEEGAPHLLDLHSRFMSFLTSYFSHVKIVSIAEGTPTMLTSFKFPLRIVTEESAFLDYGDFYILKDDHLSLSKPIFRQSFLYKRVLQVIEEAIVSTQSSGQGNPPQRKANQQQQNEQAVAPQEEPTMGEMIMDTARKAIAVLPRISLKFSTPLDVWCDKSD